MKRTIVAVALLAAVGLGIVAACGGFDSPEASVANGITHTVVRGPLRISVTETGTLKAKNFVNIKAKIPGQAKVVWLVPEGTEAKEGDKLAELDKTDVQRTVDGLDTQYITYEAEVNSARTEYQIQVADGAASVEKARLAHDIKRMELQRYQESDAPQELRKRELAVEKARSEFERKKERYEQVQDLLQQDFVTKSQVEEERIALRAAEIELQSAEDDLEGYVKFTADIERRQKESDLAEAERNLENEKLRADNLLQRKKVHHEQAQRNFETTRQKLEEARKQLEEMTVLAPAPGIVIYQQQGWNNEEMKIGATVYSDQPFLQLPDLSEMEVSVGIHEADVNKLKVGQPVFVTIDSFKGERLEGKITKIATIASERDWRSDIKKFEIVVALEKNQLPLKPGLTAKVEIVVGQVDDVLAVPLQSVFVREGRYFLFVDDGGRPARREVKLGRANDNFVAVEEGVKEGDRVLLWNPEGTEGAAPEASGEKESPAAAGGRGEGRGGAGGGGRGTAGGKP